MTTKPVNPDTEPAKPVTKNRGGRPRLGDKPLTPAERSRRARARRKQQTKPETPPSTEATAEQVLAALVQSRRIVSHFDKLLAVRAVNALMSGKIVEGVKCLEHLPAPVRSEASTPALGEHSARERVLQLIQAAIAADKVELAQRAERGEQLSERDQLRLRLAQLDEQPPDEQPGEEAEVEELRRQNVELRRLLAGAEPTSGTARVITPSIGDKQGVVTVTAEHDKPDDADGELVVS